MMSGSSSRKSGRSDDYYDENTPNKKPKQENEEPRLSVPVKYFSMTECPFGEGCPFLHVIPSGLDDDAITINFTFNESFVRNYGEKDISTFMLISSLSMTNFSIKDHESESSSKNVEFRGPNHKSIGVAREFLWQLSRGTSDELVEICPGPEFKTQLCARFSQGFCPDGACCHFAHGDQELRKSSQVFKATPIPPSP
ncbi:hypothetical protein POM88_046938 [Heracleum sosnowskyi]|uniref:C3H1-type domain-containing protein n=1 Tax=Heracleum sosnowskyi TaxID=360622 RepID=A0AAD8M7C4_9APIA|nr:hypothetical protein POM88_046938 [Heracleum sosnowskyi]